jgi:hypothetical protein
MNSSLRASPSLSPLPSADDSSRSHAGARPAPRTSTVQRSARTPGQRSDLPSVATVIAALSLPRSRQAPAAPGTVPLLLARLPRLPRDGSMLYGIARVDTSGRVAHREISLALAWSPGDRLDVHVTASAIILRRSPDGALKAPRVPYIVFPADARHRCAITAGDNVLLAAAPGYGLVIVHTISALDDMLARYYSDASLPERTS